MKKVLILAYDFPPYVSVGGLRPYNWYKYFKEFGVEPIVVTRQWENKFGDGLDYIALSKTNRTEEEISSLGQILRSPYKPNLSNRLLLRYGKNRYRLLRKLITAYYEFTQFLYIIGPKKELYKTADRYLKNNKVDAILATGDPFILFSFADKLSRKYDVPWIADYRDPWSQDIHIKSNFIIRKWNEYFEKRIVERSACITTVSEFLKAKISSLVHNQSFHILPNGYDPGLMEQVSKIYPSNKQLKIAFAGSILGWHPWKSVIKQLDSYLKTNSEARIQLNFYGINVVEHIEKYILENHPTLVENITFTPRLPNNKVLEKLASNHVMLLFNDHSSIGTKIYDYLGIRRKIVFCYSNDNEAIELKKKFYNLEEIDGLPKTLQADVINRTNSGVVENSSKLQDVLHDLWTEFKKTGNIECNSTGIDSFSRRIQVKELAKIIQSVQN